MPGKKRRCVDADGLTLRERIFVSHYVLGQCKNGAQAARDAGYTGDVGTRAYHLLKCERINAAVQKEIKEFFDRYQIKKDNVLRELASIAFCDPRQLFDKDGKLKQMSELSPLAAAAIAGIDYKAGGVVKIKFCSKLAALDLVGRFLKMWDGETAQGRDRLHEILDAMRAGPVATPAPKKETVQ